MIAPIEKLRKRNGVPHARAAAEPWRGEARRACVPCRAVARRACVRATSVLSISSLSSCSGSSSYRTSARTEIGRAGLQNPTPCIETLARVCGQSGFLGASSATTHYLGSARSASSHYIGPATLDRLLSSGDERSEEEASGA